MKNKRAFHFALGSVLFLSFLLVGVTGVSAAAPDVQHTYATTNADAVVVGPLGAGLFVPGSTITLNILQQTGNLYSGTIAITIPGTAITLTGDVAGFVSGNGKMTITIIDDAGDPVGTASFTKQGKKLNAGVVQLLTGAVISGSLRR